MTICHWEYREGVMVSAQVGRPALSLYGSILLQATRNWLYIIHPAGARRQARFCGGHLEYSPLVNTDGFFRGQKDYSKKETEKK